MRVFNKEQFWQECLLHKPDLSRRDFDQRWSAIWFLAEAMGVRIHVDTSA